MTIAIIDYGSGNLHSVLKAFEAVGADVMLATTPEHLQSASHIVLPGVGAFGDCMQGLQQSDLIPTLEHEVLTKKKPFLGICVGMQLLAQRGLEHGTHQGLGWISGDVVPFSTDPSLKIPHLKIPHMGWNNIHVMQPHPLLKGINSGTDFYFVHSYHFSDTKHAIATVDYGQTIPVAVAQDNIMGVQFHPEKSQHVGLKLLQNFLNFA